MVLKFIEATVRMDRVGENGCMKKVTERYLVAPASGRLTEAEEIVLNNLAPFVSGEIYITAAKNVEFFEVFPYHTETNDVTKYYKVRISIVTIDENTGKERHTPAHILIEATDLKQAQDILREKTKDYMLDFDTVQISETKYVDIFLNK